MYETVLGRYVEPVRSSSRSAIRVFGRAPATSVFFGKLLYFPTLFKMRSWKSLVPKDERRRCQADAARGKGWQLDNLTTWRLDDLTRFLRRPRKAFVLFCGFNKKLSDKTEWEYQIPRSLRFTSSKNNLTAHQGCTGWDASPPYRFHGNQIRYIFQNEFVFIINKWLWAIFVCFCLFLGGSVCSRPSFASSEARFGRILLRVHEIPVLGCSNPPRPVFRSKSPNSEETKLFLIFRHGFASFGEIRILRRRILESYRRKQFAVLLCRCSSICSTLSAESR